MTVERWPQATVVDARVAVRRLVTVLLGQNSDWRLDAPSGSAPRLAPAQTDPFTHVSLSHTRIGAAAAVSQTPIGVDVEWVRRRVNWKRISQTYFSITEQNQLLRQPPHNRQTAFLILWTCKEAWLKAQGHGLAHLRDATFTPADNGGWFAPGIGWHTQSRRWGDDLIISVVWRGSKALHWWYAGPDGKLNPGTSTPVGLERSSSRLSIKNILKSNN